MSRFDETLAASPPLHAFAPLRLTRSARSARSQLLRMVVVSAVTWCLAMGVAVTGVVLVHHRTEEAATSLVAAQDTNRRLELAMVTAESAVRGYEVTDSGVALLPYRTNRAPAVAAVNRLEQVGLDQPDLAAAIAAQRSAVYHWWNFPDPAGRTVTAAEDRRRQAAYAVVRDRTTTVAAGLDHALAEARHEQRGATGVALGLLVLVSVAGALLALRPSLVAARQIGRPLEDLDRTVTALRSGDLQARATVEGTTGELRAVAVTLNEFADRTASAQGRLAEEIRLAQLTADLGHLLTTTLDLDAVVAETVRWISAHFDSAVWVRAFDAERLRAGRGRAAFPVQLVPAVPPNLIDMTRRICDYCWLHQTTLLITRDEPAAPPLLTAEEGLETFALIDSTDATRLLFVPIGAGRQVLGYVCLGRGGDRPTWNELELSALREVGREVGRSVMLARLFERDHDLVEKLHDFEVRRNDFITMASHAIRTPLASIAGYLEVMRAGDLGGYDPGLEVALDAIARNSRRLNGLADDFLLLAELENGTRAHRSEVVDLQSICRAAVEAESERARAAELSVSLTLHGRVNALGDAHELGRLVEHLLSNALKFSPLGGHVRVVVRDDPERQRAVVEIQDEGPGISAADQERLFTRYFRSADAISGQVPGTGLGLRLVKLVADKHEGRLLIRAEPGHGTVVRAELPRAEPVGEDPAAAPPAETTTPEEDLAAQERAGVSRPAGVMA